MDEEKIYYFVCSRCGYVSYGFNTKPNSLIGWNNELKSCPHCMTPMKTMDKDCDYYEDLYEEMYGIDIWEGHNSSQVDDILHFFISNVYSAEHSDEIDQDAHNRMLAAEPQRLKEIADFRQAEKQLPHCPNCGSTAVHTETKGFGVGKAIAGVAVTGSLIGAAAGSIGSGKVVNICKKCGHKWSPKK